MTTPAATDVKKGISVLWETLRCPICLDLMTAPVSTNCDHQFCKFCLMKLLDNTKQNRASCPVCKAIITKRSLQESPGFNRLVSGLQAMIQAYEHDTCTNYLTGAPRPRESGLTDAEEDKHLDLSSGDSPSANQDLENVDDDDLQKSHSSTLEAQNGFARLMGLDNSSPLTENEGLDSGLGDAPLPSDRKMASPSENVETEISEVVEKSRTKLKTRSMTRVSKCTDAPLNLSTRTDEAEGKPLRKSSQRKPKSDNTLDHKQKKSLEKVAEWLLKVPSEGSLLENPSEEDSDSGSSTSTIDIWQRDNAVLPGREDRAKALEEQVFGAVYKRERRSGRISPPHNVIARRLKTKRKKSEAFSPADAVEKTIAEDKSEDVKDVDSNLFKEAEQEVLKDIFSQESTDTFGKNVNNIQDQAADVRKQRPERKSKKKTASTDQQVDRDLLEQESTEKKTDKRKKTRTAKGKPARATEPLLLVGVQNRQTSPEKRRKSGEVQVHIENYPSSEERAVPVTRNARRSRRLQVFTEEVQKDLKKVISGRKGAVDDKTPPKSRNGCVYNQDFEGIENLEGVSCLGSSEGNVPETELLPESGPTNLGRESVVDPTLAVNACGEVEHEEDKNDSEMDTEQLVRSFKTTKRKSFRLGCPKAKRTRSSDQENGFNVEVEETLNSLGSAKGPMKMCENNLEALRGDENSSDVIYPSNDPGMTGMVVPEEPEQSVVEPSSPDSAGADSVSRNVVSSPLTPNKVSKCEVESPRLSYVPNVVESGFCLTTVQHNESSKSSQMAENILTSREEVPDSASAPNSNAGLIPNVESSLTPEGLVHQVKSSDGSEEASARSSIRGRCKKRTRAQRLDSLSDSSDFIGDELPALTDIFGTSAPRPATARDRGDSRDASRREVAPGFSRPPSCPSPDCVGSSQASVDLFGTPEECEAAVNDASHSVESSQFSSEVLVTQQKVEMQEELLRLEKLMALVSEVLQEKEGGPAKTNQSSKDAGQGAHRPGPHERDSRAEQRIDPEAEPESLTTPSDAVQNRSTTEPAAQLSGHTVADVKVTAAPEARTSGSDGSPSDEQEDKENNTPQREKNKAKMVLVSSGLGPNEQNMVKKFAKRVGARVVSRVTAEVSHVIMHTDEEMVCERTLKYFLGIAGRKWVVSFQWISECFRLKKLSDESLFEVRGDVVNGSNHQGPKRARTTPHNNLLMRGYKICLHGPFTDMTTDQMEWMVELCGAAVVKDPLHLDSKQRTSHQLVIVQPGSESTFNRLSKNATVVTRSWLLDSVATYTLQNLNQYTT